MLTTPPGLAGVVLAQAPNTSGVQQWLLDNLIPLMLVLLAIMIIWKIGKTGDNRGGAQMVVGIIVGFFVLGIALTGVGPELGAWLAGLFTGT